MARELGRNMQKLTADKEKNRFALFARKQSKDYLKAFGNATLAERNLHLMLIMLNNHISF